MVGLPGGVGDTMAVGLPGSVGDTTAVDELEVVDTSECSVLESGAVDVGRGDDKD